jgi:hypothetical protein
MSEFAQKKAEEQGVKDSRAQQEALGKLGITREFKAESSDPNFTTDHHGGPNADHHKGPNRNC